MKFNYHDNMEFAAGSTRRLPELTVRRLQLLQHATCACGEPATCLRGQAMTCAGCAAWVSTQRQARRMGVRVG